MILADSELKKHIHSGNIGIITEDKYDILQQIGPASIDFRLGYNFKVYTKKNNVCIDTKVGVEKKHIKSYCLEPGDECILHPGDFVLGSTLEEFRIPDNLVARCEGRSSLGRLGIIIHSTAGFIDPGFEGTITLEITNINEIPVVLYPGMRIGQIAFEKIEGKCDLPYDKREGSKYMKQIFPEVSKIEKDLY